jgi:O-acetyl-ADP-ribose deacetylase (regulator of RNase III)
MKKYQYKTKIHKSVGEPDRSYQEITGNLLTMAKAGEFDMIVHGCNCFATMGAGIAAEVAEVFPEAKEADEKFSKTIPRNMAKLGLYSKAIIPLRGERELTVVNAYTQFMPGPDFRMTALDKWITKINAWIEHQEYIKGGYKIGFPQIGCGIGGGDWNEVKELILDKMHEKFDITFVYFKRAYLQQNRIQGVGFEYSNRVYRNGTIKG